MKSCSKKVIWTGALVGLLLFGAEVTRAQSSQGQGAQSQQQGQQQQEKPGTTSAPASNTTGLTLDAAAPPVNAEEDAAFKAFEALPNADLPKKIAAGEEFLQKYPQSRYRPPVYSVLTVAYLQTGQTQKAFDVGDKEVALSPNDVQTLAILCQTIPRAMNASTPDAVKQLEKAETYGKRAIEIVPTLPKPANLTDEKFAVAKNQALAMAHGGMGLVYVRRGKFDQAIPELEQSVKLDPNPSPDPVNYYLLGLANEKTSHFDAAIAAFTKCAGIPGSLQDTCKADAAEAKKQASTQLSAPN